jgi:HD domain-containing protein
MRLRAERHAHALALGALAIAGPGVVLGFLGHDKVHLSSTLHFAGVGFSALAAAAAALALTVVGARRGDGRTVLVGTAFAVMAALLALHGLATPGFLVGSTGLIAFTGGATLPVGAAVLALSTVPSLRRPRRVGALVVLEASLVAAILALGIAGMLVPSLVPAVPEPGDPAALAVLGVGMGFFALLLLRAVKTYALTRRGADLVVVVGIAWLTAALPPSLLFNYLQLGWWIGHGLELVGIVLVGVPVAIDLRRAVQSRPLAGDLRAAELVAEEEAFLGARVRALVLRLAEKDAYTEEHTRRVALRTVQMGELLGLPAHRLRNLAIGGLLHDIGKLALPGAILKKRGPLTEGEYAEVQRHPESGARLLAELGGFPEPVRRLVRDHHERLDGSGYPGGLTAAFLELDTRILAVCDVYDALISQRVYRPAWSSEDAMMFLRSEAGSSFDERCVAALERLVLAEEHAATYAIAV